LGNAGTYVIKVEPAVTSLQLISFSISIIWIIAFLAINAVVAAKKKWWSKKENTM
jgi:hypothetical protein